MGKYTVINEVEAETFNGYVDYYTYKCILNRLTAHQKSHVDYGDLQITVAHGVVLNSKGMAVNVRAIKTVDGTAKEYELMIKKDAYNYPAYLHRYEQPDAEDRFGKVNVN